jgi:hypothetical protein
VEVGESEGISRENICPLKWQVWAPCAAAKPRMVSASLPPLFAPATGARPNNVEQPPQQRAWRPVGTHAHVCVSSLPTLCLAYPLAACEEPHDHSVRCSGDIILTVNVWLPQPTASCSSTCR